MIKYYYPNGDHCYRALHTKHAVYRSTDGKLMARAMRPDNSALYEFEIMGFELVDLGVRCE